MSVTLQDFYSELKTLSYVCLYWTGLCEHTEKWTKKVVIWLDADKLTLNSKKLTFVLNKSSFKKRKKV